MLKSPMKISAAARAQIALGLDRIKARTGVECIPAVMWVDSELNNGIVPSGVLMGAFTEAQRNEIAHILRSDNGYEYVLSVAEEDFVRFVGKTLDYRDDNYVLV
ncbi:hypothetical protein QV13_00135 [Mesorhizobium hungaricum]|jgi:hypothetical protein|uniref:Uncharacterized protein n=2 Tax=Hyphomicrobiales TaxID=356 RepID=A0A1C2EF01_9HYPH|nr:hypothetical protein QV13_00135 [Mesorhizobium hungaricum]